MLTLNNFALLFMLIFLDIVPMGRYNRFGIVYAGGELPRVYYNPASTEVCVFTPSKVSADYKKRLFYMLI